MVDQIPRNVSLEALALSPAESKTFPRWYTDLLLRKRTDSVTIGDVLSFIENFGISQTDKNAITAVFGYPLVTLDPPQFYVILRLTGHVLQGKQLRRELAFVAAPVPKPRSILSSSRHRAASKEKPRQDMDSFMSLMIGGGNGSGSKRKKRVTFDSRPPEVTEAAHRSMEELLRQSQIQSQIQAAQPNNRPPPPPPPPEPPQQQQDNEPDQPIANNQFAKVNIDSVLHHGQSMLPEPPAPRKNSTLAGDSFIQQLTRNATPKDGAQQQQQQQQHQQQHQPQPQPQPNPQIQFPAGRLAGGLQSQGTGTQGEFLSPQVSGLRSQGTGPQFLSPQNSGWQQQQQTQGPSPTKLGPQSTGSLPMNMQTRGPLPPLPNRFPSPQVATGSSPMLQPPSMPQQSHTPSPLQLSAQATGYQGVQPGMQPQFSGIQPQTTGFQSQPSGIQTQAPTFPQGFQPNFQGGQPMAMHPASQLQSMPTGFQQPSSVSGFPNGSIAPQTTGGFQPGIQLGIQPQSTGFQGVQSQMTGFNANPGMQQPQQQNLGNQFLNSLQNPGAAANTTNGYPIAPPPQYVRNNEPYNMQALREHMPNWS